MTKKDNNKIQFEKPYETGISIGQMGYYVWFVTGLIIFIIGIVLTITNSISTGMTSANEIGEGGGQQTFITGPAAIVLGLLTLVPLYFIRKTKKIN